MIARNYCLMKLRDKNIFIEPEDKSIDNSIIEKEQLHIKDNTLSILEASLSELNTEQKTCVTLFYLQKKSYHEIAAITGYNLLQVKSHIQNGKRNLKIIVERKLKTFNE